MAEITVVFPVKNEAENLRCAIPLVRDIGPIIVVDSGSSDATCLVASELGAETLQFKWDGKFPKKRNWTLRNYDFCTEWVLFLDADEFASSDFVDEVKRVIENTSHSGFWLNFENHFMGRKMLGGDRFRKLALFRVGSGEYEKIDEDNWSHLDMEVHEHPVLDGTMGEISSPIEHNDFRGLKHYIAKHNEYSSWEAARFLRLADREGSEWNGLTNRQRKKYSNIEKWWFAPAYFFASFVVQKGFRDGVIGFHFAFMKAIYFYQIRLKILEQRGKGE